MIGAINSLVGKVVGSVTPYVMGSKTVKTRKTVKKAVKRCKARKCKKSCRKCR